MQNTSLASIIATFCLSMHYIAPMAKFVLESQLSVISKQFQMRLHFFLLFDLVLSKWQFKQVKQIHNVSICKLMLRFFYFQVCILGFFENYSFNAGQYCYEPVCVEVRSLEISVKLGINISIQHDYRQDPLFLGKVQTPL